MKALYLLIALQMIVPFALSAQVKFKLTRVEQRRYQIKLLCEENPEPNGNITSTIQISLKSPSDMGVVLEEITSDIEGLNWELGTKLHNPNDDLYNDYFTINLKTIGTKLISYSKGKEIPILSFHLKANVEIPEIHLISSQEYLTPSIQNSRYNLGQHIGVIGYGYKNSFSGSLEESLQVNDLPICKATLSPNPTSSISNLIIEDISYVKDASYTISVIDLSRNQEVINATIQDKSTVLKLQNFASGNYSAFILKDGTRVCAPLKLQLLH